MFVIFLSVASASEPHDRQFPFHILPTAGEPFFVTIISFSTPKMCANPALNPVRFALWTLRDKAAAPVSSTLAVNESYANYPHSNSPDRRNCNGNSSAS